MRKMWKRIICSILIAAMLFTELPMNAMATSDPGNINPGNTDPGNTGTGSRVFGDANGDGVLDAQDIAAILQYIVENNPLGFQEANADVTEDGVVDLKDLLAVRKHLNEEMLSVSFYDGDSLSLIDILYVEKGSPLKRVPSVGKSSKENAILLGYYTDQACTEPFYAENPVTDNMNVYAKYQKINTASEELNFTSFAEMDASPDLYFEIEQKSGSIPFGRAAVLEVKDGSDPVVIKIDDPDGDGCYKVYAPEGFRKGASYELNLAEGWVFKDKEETIRTAAFSIKMEEVKNLKMSDEIVYIKDTNTINYTVDGKKYEELTSEAVAEKGGDVKYADADAKSFENIEKDDILCIYVGVHPDERDSKQRGQLLDPIVYVKVTSIDNRSVSFAPLDSEDQVKMYDIPDNFPIAIKGISMPEAEENTDSVSGNTVDGDSTGEDSVSGNTAGENNAGEDENSDAAKSEDSTDKNNNSGTTEDEDSTGKNNGSGTAKGEDNTGKDNNSGTAEDGADAGKDNNSGIAEGGADAGRDSNSGIAEGEAGTGKDNGLGNTEGEAGTGEDSGLGTVKVENGADEWRVFVGTAIQTFSEAAMETPAEKETVGTDNKDNAGSDSGIDEGTSAGGTTSGGTAGGETVGADNKDNAGTGSGTEEETSAGGTVGGENTGDDKEDNAGTGSGTEEGTSAGGITSGGTAGGENTGADKEDNTGTGSGTEEGTSAGGATAGGENAGADNKDNAGTGSGSEEKTPVKEETVSGNSTSTEETVSGNSTGTEETVSGNSVSAEDTSDIADDGEAWQPDLGTEKGTVKMKSFLAALDLDMYRRMMGDESLTREKVQEKISKGDFITLYSSSGEIKSEDSLYYARIVEITEIPGSTENDEPTYIITYEKTTRQAILESMDVYDKAVIEGDDLVSEEQKQEIEAQLLAQLEASGFAEDAAYILGDIVTKTDGFRNNMSIQELLLTDDEGNPLTNEEIQLMNLGGTFELSDEVKLKAELITKGDQLHFGNGVQLAIQVKAEFEVEGEDGKVAIELTASFVQEVALSPSVRGDIVTKEILFIPIPVGVKVNAAIDIKNYTAFSFNAEIYTVAKEDESTWEKLQAICKDPKELLGLDGIPEGLKAGLETAGDVMDKINEIKSKIDQASDTVDKIKGYEEDLNTLWGLVESNGLTTRAEWEEMEETLGKTNVASDLLDMLDLTTETDISTEYLESMQALMDKYVETVEKETDWVQLVNKEIMSKEFYLGSTPIVVGAEVNFVVRMDMSVALGSNLEYEVGKRYNFWFKIGLFKPSAGSSSMDLLDERFAFQFYVMGRLGLKTGIRAKLYVGLGSGKFASVGITAELGPYIKLYGFFVYEFTKYRPKNTQDWTSKERMAGALYLDFGLYFMLGFEANALGNLFEYSYDFLDEEVPLLTAGEARYYYQNAYQPEEGDMVIVRDEDGDSTNGVTMKVPDDTIALSYVDLDTGLRGSEAVDYEKYHYTVSNPNFKIDPATGVISVDVPENTRFMECDLTVTYLYGKMAFSQYDMAVTLPLVWTNLSEDELNEYYTASVRIGNDKEGYQTVWTKRLLKNQPFDLPTDEEMKEMIGWSEAKFTGGKGYDGQATTDLTLIQDTVYNYHVEYKHYSITVTGIQNADGTTKSENFTTRYGECFDFSRLMKSGIEKPGVEYKKFAGVKTDATIMAGGKEQVIDLTQAIGGKAAAAIDQGINAVATYIDDSVTVKFEFTGITHKAEERLIRKGTLPDLNEIAKIVAETKPEYDIVNITPAFGKVSVPTVFHVTCGILPGPKKTLVFHENGGSDVKDIEKAVGAYLGILPEPERPGYSFDGWYTDDVTFRNLFLEWKMPENGADLYARWIENDYVVTFDVNGGNELNAKQQTKTVTYNGKYGSLPAPTKTSHAFLGWFTEQEGGTQITADTSVAIPGDHALYAHWKQLKAIPKNVFDFGETEGGVYSKGKTHEVKYSFDAGQENITQESFKIRYMRQGNSSYEAGLPVNAGTYNATVSRPADDVYDKFEYTYTAVIKINKAVRTIGPVKVEAEEKGYTFVKLKVDGDGGIDDLSKKATFTYQAKIGSTVWGRSAHRDPWIYDLTPGNTYDITVKVTGDPNYEDAESTEGVPVSTMKSPTDSWVDEGNYSTEWYDSDPEADTFVLKTAADLAGLSALIRQGKFKTSGKTIKLAANVDLRGHKWYPIACQSLTTGIIPGMPIINDVWFRGTFDGQNHKITGLYINGGDVVGLFGRCGEPATIKNIMLDHSYVRGGNYVGGIVGRAGYSIIDNCVNYAYVQGDSTDSDASTGGILGYSDDKSDTRVVNCVNYGYVYGTGDNAGGIVGYLYQGEARNNANYGRVVGKNCVGGVAGHIYRTKGKIYNNFTVGRVWGNGDSYIGAVIGRIDGNAGDADQCYYLRYSASCNHGYRNAVGTKNGSLDDGKEGYNNAYFTSPTSSLSRTCEEGADNDNLKGALNRWVTRCNKQEQNPYTYSTWVEGGRDGYPIPKGSMIPEAVQTRE